MSDSEARAVDVLVIGGGQAGSAAGYHLRRAGLDFVIFDGQDQPGGAWRQAWPSLRLFSPARYSSLPVPVPAAAGGGYPTASDTVAYLTDYQQRYQLPVLRSVRTKSVHRTPGGLLVHTSGGDWRAKVVISATGTWSRPLHPRLPRQVLADR